MEMSFNDAIDEIPILPGGTPACMGDHYPYGSGGKITKKATIAESRLEGWEIEGQFTENEVLYWFEYANKNYPAEYVWRSNLYPVPYEDWPYRKN